MKYGKRMLIGALLLTTFVLNMAAPASAYVYNGYYWHIGYAQVNQDSTIPSGWSSSLSAAASTWTNAGASFHFSWISTNNKLHYGPLSPASTLASTYPSRSGDRMISCSTTFNSNDAWSTSGASGCVDIQACATHEFGHWLSLGHSSNTKAVMYKNMNLGDKSDRYLKSDDINGIKRIYP